MQKEIEKLSHLICGQMDANLIESIVSLFNKGILVHYVGSPRTTFNPERCKLTVAGANGVMFEGREKIIELEKENEKLKSCIDECLAIAAHACLDTYNNSEALRMCVEEMLKTVRKQ